MCRMLGVVSRDPIAFDQAIAEEIEPFTAQSDVHKDGWGVGWFNQSSNEPSSAATAGAATGGAISASEAQGSETVSESPKATSDTEAPTDADVHRTPAGDTVQIRRHLAAARESAAYREALTEAHGPMMLVHLRKASPGLALQLSNTHPFRCGEALFAHNGQFDLSEALISAILARGGRTPEGSTDSELYLSLIELHARTMEPVEAIQHAAADITALLEQHGTRPPEAMNCLFMTPTQLIAYQQSDPAQAQPHHTDDNYVLRYRVDPARVIVASTGIPTDGWFELGEGEALVIDRDSMDVRVQPALTSHPSFVTPGWESAAQKSA